MDHDNLLNLMDWADVAPRDGPPGNNAPWVLEVQSVTGFIDCHGDVLLAVKPDGPPGANPRITINGRKDIALIPAPQYGEGWLAPEWPIFPTNFVACNLTVRDCGDQVSARYALNGTEVGLPLKNYFYEGINYIQVERWD